MTYRFFHPELFSPQSTIHLSPKEEHHAKKVMRLRANDPVEIVNGKGQLAKGLFNDAIEIKEVISQEKLPYITTLILSLPEANHLELIVEKATEIGIDRFIIYPSKRSKQRELFPSKRSRIEVIAISALKQCKRLFLPEIHFVNSCKDVIIRDTLLLADPSGASYKGAVKQSKAIVVGPESGLTEEEKRYWIQERGALAISLGNHVLRCETAAILSAYEITKNY